MILPGIDNKSVVKSAFNSFLHAILFFCFMHMFIGCFTWTRYTKLFGGDSYNRTVREWNVSVYVYTDFTGEDKDALERELGHSPEEVHDYSFSVAVWNVPEVDKTLSLEELHEIRIDSANITFNDFSKTFITENSFKENRRTEDGRNFGYLYPYARRTISFGELYIPPGTEVVDVTVYGVTRNQNDGVQPFEIPVHLKYIEKTERATQYMD